MSAKRLLDVVVSAVALVVLSPVFLVVAVLVRLALGAPILFSQCRPGLHQRPVVIYKFRTMLGTTDQHGRLLPDERRMTRVGRFLRSTSLDELPELFNVLRGDMSLVGPRPLLMEYLDRYTPEQARRHEVKPGITGWAQINGRNAVGWEEKFALDLWYVDHWSLRLDLWILLLTIWRVLKREGITHPAHSSMPEFRGYGQPVGDDL